MLPTQQEEKVYRAVEIGLLRIDDEGRIWRRKGRRHVRAEKLTGNGYLQVRWMVMGKRHHALAHRLVWRHFKGSIPDRLTINHKDGDKANNNLGNLELATYSEQAIHARRVLGKCRQDGEKNPAAKLTASEVVEIRRQRKSGQSLKAIAALFGISDKTVSKIALGHRWAALAG